MILTCFKEKFEDFFYKSLIDQISSTNELEYDPSKSITARYFGFNLPSESCNIKFNYSVCYIPMVGPGVYIKVSKLNTHPVEFKYYIDYEKNILKKI